MLDNLLQLDNVITVITQLSSTVQCILLTVGDYNIS